MQVEGYNVPEYLMYHREHIWVKPERDHLLVGWTDFAQKTAGDVTYMDLPGEGDAITADKPFGTVETGKWVGKLYAPVDGTVLEVNTDVTDDATVVNKNPYAAWIIKVQMRDPSQMGRLLNWQAYVQVMRQKMAEIKAGGKA